jgi:hypothetical protein
VTERTRAQAADAGFAEPDLRADLLQREPAPERQHEDLPFDRIDVPQLVDDATPPAIALRPADRRGAWIQSRSDAPIERDLDDRRRKIGVLLARLAVRAPRGAGERVALAERVEHLAAHAPRGVRAEGRTRVVAIAPRRLDEPDDAPGHEVLAIGAAAARIERARGDRSGEPEVRDDAFVARLKIHFPLPGGTVSTGRDGVNNAVTDLSTESDGYFARYRYPDWLRAHSRVVGAIATRLAEAHVAAGHDVDVRIVGLGGYLHDIGKSPLLRGDARDHNVLGPLVLAAEGLPELAELARRHPVYAPRDPATAPRTLAEKIVYYADRRGAQTVVTLEERIDEQLARFPELAHLRSQDLASARAIEAEVFAGIALRPEDLAGPAGSIE